MVGPVEGACPLQASVVLSLLGWDVVKTASMGVLVNIAQAEPRGLVQRVRLEAWKQPAGDTTEGKAGDGGIRSVSVMEIPGLVVSTPPLSICGCVFVLEWIKTFQTGSHTSANVRVLLNECEKYLLSSKTVSFCFVEEVIVCPQLGRVARLVCVPGFIAHRLLCKWPGYPRVI